MAEASDALKVGSLCTGYGGLDAAVMGEFGGSLAWVADNDPGASRILAHHHPAVPNLGDITAVDWSTLEPVDILCGGYPCQPFSTAGRRKGTADARHIWPHIARALGVLRPRYAVFENVAGHLSLGFDTVLADLARLGFDAEWVCVRASDIGAAHQRKRLFLLARPADAQGPRRQRPGLPRRPAGRGGPVAHPFHLGAHRGGPRGTGRDEHAARRLSAAHTGDSGLKGHGEFSSGRDALRKRIRVDPDRRHAAAPDTPGFGRGEGRSEPARIEGGPDPALGSSPDWGPYSAAIARWESVIGRPAPRPTDALGRLNPHLVEWLMGLPAGHVTGVPGLSRAAQLKALGNGVMPQQAAAALPLLNTRSAPTDSHLPRVPAV